MLIAAAERRELLACLASSVPARCKRPDGNRGVCNGRGRVILPVQATFSTKYGACSTRTRPLGERL